MSATSGKIQPRVFLKQQPRHAVAHAGGLPRRGKRTKVMLAPVQMDIRLKAGAVAQWADAGITAGVGAAALLVESILLVRTQPKVAAAVIQLVAADVIHFEPVDIGKQQAMQHNGFPVHMGRRISALAQMPGMRLDDRQVCFIEPEFTAIGKGGNAVAVAFSDGISHSAPPFRGHEKRPLSEPA